MHTHRFLFSKRLHCNRSYKGRNKASEREKTTEAWKTCKTPSTATTEIVSISFYKWNHTTHRTKYWDFPNRLDQPEKKMYNWFYIFTLLFSVSSNCFPCKTLSKLFALIFFYLFCTHTAAKHTKKKLKRNLTLFTFGLLVAIDHTIAQIHTSLFLGTVCCCCLYFSSSSIWSYRKLFFSKPFHTKQKQQQQQNNIHEIILYIQYTYSDTKSLTHNRTLLKHFDVAQSLLACLLRSRFSSSHRHKRSTLTLSSIATANEKKMNSHLFVSVCIHLSNSLRVFFLVVFSLVFSFLSNIKLMRRVDVLCTNPSRIHWNGPHAHIDVFSLAWKVENFTICWSVAVVIVLGLKIRNEMEWNMMK